MKRLILALCLGLFTMTAQAKPILLWCYNPQDPPDRVFVVISDTYDFMMFGPEGRWMNQGTFRRDMTDTGRTSFHAVISGNPLRITEQENGSAKLYATNNAMNPPLTVVLQCN